MDRVKMEKLIGKLVVRKRAAMINVLRSSNVRVPNNISNQDLYNLIINQLDKGNINLVVNLGNLIDSVFDMKEYAMSFENKSNTDGFSLTPEQIKAINEALPPEDEYTSAPKKQSWWQKNKEGVFGAGTTLLGNLFGIGKDKAPTAPPKGDPDWMAKMQEEQEAYEEEKRRREEEARKREQTMWIVGGVIAFLAIAGTITAVVISKKKNK